MRRRIVELDGLRGLAILMVFVAHYVGEAPSGISAFAVGWLGVDIFFVLSGFLIGGILLDSIHLKGGFRSFYLRRIFRTLPIYYLTVAATLLAASALGGPQRSWIDAGFDLVYYLFHAQNFAIVNAGGHGLTWLLPTWTLAVEEQFYLVFPFVVAFVPRQYLLRAALAGIAAAPLLRWWFFSDYGWNYAGLVLLPARMDLFLFGFIVARLMRSPYRAALFDPKWSLALKLAALSLAWLQTLIVFANFGLKWPPAYSVFQILGPSLTGASIGIYLVLVLGPHQEGNSLRARMLVFLGTISYGLYLVHQPISGIMHGLLLDGRPDVGTPEQIAVTVLAALMSIVVAWLSWNYFEKPMLALGHRLSVRETAPEQGTQAAAHH